MTEITFEKLRLIDPILKALDDNGYNIPTQIQAEAIPQALAENDILAVAPTGTGKTAAFAIPIIQLLTDRVRPGKERDIKALILTPTRELALQIEQSFKEYGKYTQIKAVAIFGGVSQKPQEEALNRGVDVLIATPGRLLDLLTQKKLTLDYLDILVLDEADRMLDMGFIHDVKRIIKVIPAKRQTLYFSATMPSEVVKLSESLLKNPIRIEVKPLKERKELIEQNIYLVEKENKKSLLKHLLSDSTIESVIIFTRTKYGADKLSKDLIRMGLKADALHGDKSQNARQRALLNFKDGIIKILVATDIAARGIDVDNVSHVINYDIPNEPETYIHRIGRTGRAGASGIAISLCSDDEIGYLKDIQLLVAKPLNVVAEHPYKASFDLSYRASKSNSSEVKKSDFRHGRRPSENSSNHHGRKDIAPHNSRKPKSQNKAEDIGTEGRKQIKLNDKGLIEKKKKSNFWGKRTR